MPACVLPVTEQTTTVSKKTPSSFSCASSSRIQFAKPSPPSGWSEAPAGMAYGFPSPASSSATVSSQAFLKPMLNPALTSRTSAPSIRDSWMLPAFR